MKNIVNYIKESYVNHKSKQYYKGELGFDPTEVDYSHNKKAQEIIDTFTQHNKLAELYDYLVAGISDKMSKQNWIKYVADTDIADYEEYNGKLED